MAHVLTTEEAVREHIRALRAEEWEAVVDGYADDAVILIAPDPVVGKAAIHALFTGLPAGAGSGEVVIDHFLVEGEHALVVYRHAPQKGADSFVVRDGKIVMQSVYLAPI